MSDAEDKELSEEEKKKEEEKKRKYEEERESRNYNLLKISWQSKFCEVLDHFGDKGHWEILDFYSPTTGKELYDSLTELWNINFQLYYQKAKIEEMGHVAKITKRWVSISYKNKSDGGKSEGPGKMYLDIKSFNEKNNERRKTKRELRLQGEVCHSFWLTEKWEKLGEVISEHMIEAVKKRAENDVGVGLAKFSIMYLEFFEPEEDKVITKEQRYKDLAAAKTKAKAWEDSMLAFIEEVTVGFVKDLTEVQQKVEHDLEGWRYHWKRFSEVAVPILALSTFALAALRIWLALKNGELSEIELLIAVVVVLLVIERGIFNLYKMNK